MASAVMPVATGRDMSRYLGDIHKFPMLSAGEELDLARRWRDRQDLHAVHTLVNAHLRLVAKIARSYGGYGLSITDLVSEGNVGMMQAVRRFDPDRGFRLATYAIWWIRAAMQEYILHNWSLVKMGTTGAQKKLFFNLRRIKGQMQAIDNRDLAPEQVAKVAHLLDVPEHDVVSMNRRLAAPDHSLNAPVRTAAEGEWQDWLVDESASQESVIADREEFSSRHALLPDALRTLNQRQLHIVTERWLRDDPVTLEELSHRYGISRERVRQIEMGAFKKLRAAMGAPAAGPGLAAPMKPRRVRNDTAAPAPLPGQTPPMQPPTMRVPAMQTRPGQPSAQPDADRDTAPVGAAAVVPFPPRPGAPAGAGPTAQRHAPEGQTAGRRSAAPALPGTADNARAA